MGQNCVSISNVYRMYCCPNPIFFSNPAMDNQNMTPCTKLLSKTTAPTTLSSIFF